MNKYHLALFVLIVSYTIPGKGFSQLLGKVMSNLRLFHLREKMLSHLRQIPWINSLYQTFGFITNIFLCQHIWPCEAVRFHRWFQTTNSFLDAPPLLYSEDAVPSHSKVTDNNITVTKQPLFIIHFKNVEKRHTRTFQMCVSMSLQGHINC